MTEELGKYDPSSFSNPEQCVVTHIDLKLDVDFKNKILKGCVILSVKRNAGDHLILDTRDLTIYNVSDNITQENLTYNLGSPISCFGSKLEITLPPKSNTEKSVIKIDYETSPKSTALQWLEPNLTAGKKHPYLYSHCQAIHARSLLPCQDTPGVKSPYSALITAPRDLTVLMSAIRNGEELDKNNHVKKHKFVQKVPIPIYLIAIVVGALEKRKIGTRSHVWSEKEFVDKAAEEFSETEEMLSIAENLLGEYVWGIYDMLVLPPSFPMGGMENPCLTFLTPSLLAGDKSLACVVAHEITHSWTGNLVTNQNFEHFWLNEGFTRFIECKIVGKMKGESARHLVAMNGWECLEYAVESFGEKHSLTHLVPNLNGIDPDEAFSSIPYEKGCAFLFYLETLLGGANVFDKFLKAYIEEFKYQSIDTETWKKYLYRYFSDKENVLNQVDWNAWLYSPGMPPIKPGYDDSLIQRCIELSNSWTITNEKELNKFSAKDIAEFSTEQLIKFLSILLKKEPLSFEKFEKITDIYGFKDQLNSEIRFRWIRLGLRAQSKGIINFAVQFITQYGRLKFIKPIYKDMYEWDESRDIAISTYNKNRTEMMHISASAVAKELNLLQE